MAKGPNKIDGVHIDTSSNAKGMSLATTALGLVLSGVATQVGKAEAALPAPTFEAATNVQGASTVGIHEAWPTAIDPDPTNGTSDDVEVFYTESDGSYYAPKYLAAGSAVASDVDTTNISEAWGCQVKSTTAMVCLDDTTTPQELTDISALGDWSSVSTTPSLDYYGTAGEIAYDQMSGEGAITVNSGDFGLKYTDGSVLVDNSKNDETVPIIDATRGRAFYRKNNSEMWMIDLSNGSEQHVKALDSCDYGALEPNGLKWYCAELNGSGDYDITVRRETTYDTTAVDADGDGVDSSTDCDDTDAAINPSAAEVCDGVDNNCDGVTDTDATDRSTWYQDKDGDGFGSAAVSELACDQPVGYVADGTDYDDNDKNVHTEPEPDVCEGGESASGKFIEGQTICAPEGSGLMIEGSANYDAAQDLTLMADARDWVEYMDSLKIDSSTYNGLVITTEKGSRGGYALAIDSQTMNSYVQPPSNSPVTTLRVDQGQVLVENLVTGASDLLGVGTHALTGEALVDKDGDGVYDNSYLNPDAFPDDAEECADNDGDGTGDNADRDDDNDGYSDAEETAEGTNPFDGSSHPAETGDTAGDSGDTAVVVDTDEPETGDTASDSWEVTDPDKVGCNCSASTELSLTNGKMPWLALGLGVAGVVGRRKARQSA